MGAEYELRNYQTDAISRLREAHKGGVRCSILTLPTGAGKSVIAAAIVKSATDKGRSVLLLAPRRELVYQLSDKLRSAGVPHGLLMAGERGNPMSRVQVACVPTLHARSIRRDRLPLPNASLVIVDEVQFAGNMTTSSILKAYPKATIIGMSATPARRGGQALGDLFEDIVVGPSVAELTQLGHLVPVRYFVPSSPNLKGVKVQAGDYNEKQLGERMDNQTLIGDVLTNWLRVASDRKTVIFTVSVAHSLHIEQAFREAGIAIAHLDSETPVEERKEILRKLGAGEIQVITQCDICSYGWDSPSVSCAVLARPTKSLVRYLQTAGRVLRPHPGKTDAIILDHGNCVAEHGLVDDPHEWSLDKHTTVQERDAKKSDPKEAKEIVCPACKFVFKRTNVCPGCGHVLHTHKPNGVTVIQDDLAELRSRKPFKRQWSDDGKRYFYGELLTIAAQRGYNKGWPYHKFKERIGEPPEGWSEAKPVSVETRAWLRSRQIAWAKSKHNPRNQRAQA